MTVIRTGILAVAIAAMGLVWEVDADRQQEIIGGKPVCNGRIWQPNVSCAGEAPQCADITGAQVYQPILLYNNTYNHTDTRCSQQEFKNREPVSESAVTVVVVTGWKSTTPHASKTGYLTDCKPPFSLSNQCALC